MHRHYLMILAILLIALSATAEVIDIDNEQLQSLLAEGVPVVDVRTPPEWQQTGVIAGSHRLMFFDPVGRYDARQWLAELQSIAGPDEPVILICRTGNRTSTISAFLAGQAGYETVYNVRHGITSWIASGRPVSPVAAGNAR